MGSDMELFRFMTLANGGTGLSDTDKMEILALLSEPRFMMSPPTYKTLEQFKK